MKLFSLLLVSLSLASAIVIPSDVGLTKRSLETFFTAPSSFGPKSPVRPKIVPEFKNYKIIKPLGEGTYSEVYLAEKLWKTPTTSHPSVALKTFPFSELQAAGKEVKILQRISPHPNIVELVGTTRSKLHFAIILEYISGGDLFGLINNYHEMLILYDFRLVKLIFKQLLEAVLHIHKKGIVHRDLKPENILVSPAKDYSVLVKLSDFGLAHDVGLSPIPAAGTLVYVPPEVINDNLSDVDPRKIDVWALGVILFGLIEGRLPFEADAIADIPPKISNGVYHFETSVPEAAKALVAKMLTVDWKDRAGVQEIIEDDWLKTDAMFLVRVAA